RTCRRPPHRAACSTSSGCHESRSRRDETTKVTKITKNNQCSFLRVLRVLRGFRSWCFRGERPRAAPRVRRSEQPAIHQLERRGLREQNCRAARARSRKPCRIHLV